ncbi:MAG: hypothetical protein U9P73_01090 [Candidatus Cloacimonadota bacterium]|nr:hypothetical protein [Candidatus Cloacimonadota bacterium]
MKKILVILILSISLSLFAQYDFTLTVSPLHRTYNVLYPANFNPDEPELQPNLFNLTINGTSTTNAVLYCKMIWEDEYAEITLTPNTPGQFPTNLSSEEIINSAPVGFTTVESFGDFLDSIEDLIIDTGRMPDGNYIFEIGIYEEGQEGEDAYLLSNKVTAIIVIRSPISISLITPGNPIGLGVTNISEPFPNFIWFSNLEEYTIRIYELDGVYDTVEEIEMLEPYFVEMNIGGTSFSYPPNAPEFVLNQTYAWQVSALVMSPIAASESEYKSTMYLFRLSDSASEESSLQILINFLNQLDIDGVDEIISLLEAGYTIDNIIWRGSEISAEDLMEILEEISSGNIEPIKITVE